MKLKQVQNFLICINNYANNAVLTNEGEREYLDSEKYFQYVNFVEITKENFKELIHNSEENFIKIDFSELYKKPSRNDFYKKCNKTSFPMTDYTDFNQIFISKQNNYIFKENIRNAFLELILELDNNEIPKVYRQNNHFCYLFQFRKNVYKLEFAN